jgi:hypothetical protein
MAATKNIDYQDLIERIGHTYQSAKSKIITAVNTEMLHAYWQIGKDIIEFEQGGNIKAEYGKQLMENLAKDLSLRLGQGFSRSNLNYMRLLYIKYPICETLSHKLSWSHYYELLKVDDDLAREFYEKQTITESWTIREISYKYPSDAETLPESRYQFQEKGQADNFLVLS